MDGDKRLAANQQAVLKPWNLSSVTTSSNSVNGILQILLDNMCHGAGPSAQFGFDCLI